MTKQPATKSFAEAADISIGYASDMLNGKRPMPLALAIHMYRVTGWKHSSIEALSHKQIKAIETVQPWVAPSSRPAKTGVAA